MGPSALVVKRGEYGAMLVDKNGVFWFRHSLWKSRMTHGRWPCLAGGFMGYLAGCGQKSDTPCAAPWFTAPLWQFHGRGIRAESPQPPKVERDTREGTPHAN